MPGRMNEAPLKLVCVVNIRQQVPDELLSDKRLQALHDICAIGANLQKRTHAEQQAIASNLSTSATVEPRVHQTPDQVPHSGHTKRSFSGFETSSKPVCTLMASYCANSSVDKKTIPKVRSRISPCSSQSREIPLCNTNRFHTHNKMDPSMRRTQPTLDWSIVAVRLISSVATWST